MAEMTNDRRRHTYPWGEIGDEAVRILTELTGDFERFDSIIHDQRDMLEQRAGQLRRAGDIARETRRLKLEAAEIAMRTRRALEQLRHLASPARAQHRDDSEDGLASERRTG